MDINCFDAAQLVESRTCFIYRRSCWSIGTPFRRANIKDLGTPISVFVWLIGRQNVDHFVGPLAATGYRQQCLLWWFNLQFAHETFPGSFFLNSKTSNYTPHSPGS
jgi:hypothetical protein